MSATVYALVAGAAVFVLVLSLLPGSQPGLLATRLDKVAPAEEIFDIDALELGKPLSERVFQPMMAAVGGYMLRRTKAGQTQQLRVMIMQAGSDMRPEKLLAYKVLGLVAGGLVAWGATAMLNFSALTTVASIVGGIVLGYFYPSSRLKGRIKKRAEEMRRDLPGVLDLLTISMEAGLSFDMSLSKVCESEGGIIGQEFQHVLNEVRLGRPRMEALAALGDRNAVEELTGFVRAVVQAEPLGVSVASVLRIQSEELRRLRKQRAEEKGHQAPVKMLIPMMGCIFPCIFIILLGPAAITVATSVSGK